MSVYSENTIKEVLNKLDIDQVLKRINYRLDTIQDLDETIKCFCPMHKEEVFRTLIINKKDKTYKCSYSLCPGHKGGDLISLYARSLQLDYDQALPDLVKNFNLAIELPATQEYIERQVEVAENYLELGIFDEAKKALTSVLQEQPGNLRAHEGMLELYLAQENQEKADQEVYTIITLHIENENYDAAINVCKQLLERNPDNFTGREKLAECYFHKEEVMNALGEYMNLAELYEVRGELDKALEVYRKIESLNSEIIDVYPYIVHVLMALGRKEEIVTESLNRAEQARQEQQYDYALEYYRYVLDAEESRNDIRFEYIKLVAELDRAEQYIAECMQLIDELVQFGNPEMAIEALKILHEAAPWDKYLLEKLIDIYGKLGQEDEAINYLILLSDIYTERNEMDKARHVLEELLQKRPEEPAALKRLADVHQFLRDKVTAAEIYRRTLEIYQQRSDLENTTPIYDALLQLDPDDMQLKEEYMQTLIQLGKNEEAFNQSLQLIEILEGKEEHERVVELINFALNLVPDHEELLTKLANIHQVRGQTKEAKATWYRLYQILLDKNELDPAAERLQTIISIEPEDVEAIWALAELYVKMEQMEKARTELEKLGQLFIQRNEPLEAVKVFQRVLALQPDDIPAINKLAELYQRLNDREKLVETLSHLQQVYENQMNYDQVISLGKQLLKINPHHIEACHRVVQAYQQKNQAKHAIAFCFRLAKIYGRQKALDKQKEIYNAILELDNTQVAARRRLIALLQELQQEEEATQQVNILVNQYIDQQKIKPAIKLLSDLLETRPEQPAYHLQLIELYEQAAMTREMVGQVSQLINIYKKEKNFAEVINWYKKLISLEPENVNFRIGLIEGLNQIGDFENSINEYHNLASWYEERDNLEDAIATYQNILNLDIDNEKAHKKLIEIYGRQNRTDLLKEQSLQLCNIYEREGELADAVQTLEPVIEIEKQDINLRHKLIEFYVKLAQPDKAQRLYGQIYDIYMDQGELDKAIEVQQKAIEIQPEVPELHRPLVAALLAKGDKAQAIDELFAMADLYTATAQFDKVKQLTEEILEFDPQNVRARRLKAESYLKTGEEKKALAEFMELTAELEKISHSTEGQAPASPMVKEPSPVEGLPILEEYNFNTFVVGDKNHFAYATALAIAKAPAQNYNPLFLYSDVGLGKTHLLHAMANYIKEHKSDAKIIYTNANEFTGELVEAIQENTINQFRNKYKNSDILLLDDVHFLAGKERAQEEFFHIFNTLFQARRQIVVTSDRPPKDIAHLEKRLKSRFGSGVIVDIQPPDYETRTAILKKELENHPDITVPDDIIQLVTETVETNVRDLKAALTQIIATLRLKEEPIDAETVKHILNQLVGKV